MPRITAAVGVTVACLVFAAVIPADGSRAATAMSSSGTSSSSVAPSGSARLDRGSLRTPPVVEVDYPDDYSGLLPTRGARRVLLQARYRGSDPWSVVEATRSGASGAFEFDLVFLVHPPANPLPPPLTVRGYAPPVKRHGKVVRPASSTEQRTLPVVYPRVGSTGRLSVVSVSSAERGGDGNSGETGYSVSGDGRFVAFGSAASWADPTRTRLGPNVFLRDRATGRTTLVSRGLDGLPTNKWAINPLISANGRWVVYASDARTLVRHDTDRAYDIFLWNRHTHRTSLLKGVPQSRSVGGAPLAISATGRFIAFSSGAPDLPPAPEDRAVDLYVLDRRTGVAEQLPTPRVEPGRYDTDGEFVVSMSDDGRYLAYAVEVPDHDDGHAPNNRELVFTDRLLGTTRTVPTDPTGALEEWEDNEVLGTTMTGDGRYVAFTAPLDPLTGSEYDRAVFVWDSVTGTASEVPETLVRGYQDAQYGPVGLDLSPDGRYLVFQKTPVAGGQVYRLDRTTGAMDELLRNPPDGPDRYDAGIAHPVVSRHGSTVVFAIDAVEEYVHKDVNQVMDVFVWDAP